MTTTCNPTLAHFFRVEVDGITPLSGFHVDSKLIEPGDDEPSWSKT